MYYDGSVRLKKTNRKDGVNIVLYDKPFVDSVFCMKQNELQILYDTCFDSVQDRVDRCVYLTGTDSERQRFVSDVMYLSVVAKTLAAVSGKSVDLYDFTENVFVDEMSLEVVSYQADDKDVDFLKNHLLGRNQFLVNYEPIMVAEDRPDFWY